MVSCPSPFHINISTAKSGDGYRCYYIMKKVFVKPEMEVLEIERTTIIAQSGEGGGGQDSIMGEG